MFVACSFLPSSVGKKKVVLDKATVSNHFSQENLRQVERISKMNVD